MMCIYIRWCWCIRIYEIIRESIIGNINYIATISFCLTLITDCYATLAILLVLLLPTIYAGLFVVEHIANRASAISQ